MIRTKVKGNMQSLAPQEHTPAEACLRPILGALDWTGDLRHLYEVMPDNRQIADFAELQDVLSKLNYKTVRLKIPHRKIDADTLPGLLRTADGDVWAVIARPAPNTFRVFAGRDAELRTVKASQLRGTYYYVRQKEDDTEEFANERFGWLSGLLSRENTTIRLLFLLSFVINSFALTLPIYLMLVFDMAIGARSQSTLFTLAGCILMIVAAEVVLRELRGRAIARLAVRTQTAVMQAVIQRILRMPLSYVENAPVSGQLNRLRNFESVRDIFSGPLASSLLDMPFILVFLIAVFIIGGPLGWILVAFLAAMAALVAYSVPRARAQSRKVGKARAQSRQFRIELASKADAVRDAGAQDVWIRRYRDLIAAQLGANSELQRVNFTEQTVSQALSMITGACVVGVGALQVMAGALSVGALVALMAIVWRILSPIQTAFLNLNRVFQAIDTANQVNQVMQLPQESISGDIRKFYRRIRGHVAVENIGFRYGTQGVTALRGVDLSIEAGGFVAITGEPGAGCSTLLKLLDGQYPPSFGRILIDGLDTRQYDIRELRRAIALVNDQQVVFSGTLAENLRLANPLADDNRLAAAIHDADLQTFVDELPHGLDTDLGEWLSDGLGAAVRQKIRLARAYLQTPAIYLLDTPEIYLDQPGQAALISKLTALKGHATIIVTTSDERLIKLADRSRLMKSGRLSEPAIIRSTNAPRLADTAPGGGAHALGSA